MSKLILFQGDSITDAFRNYDISYFSGSGYATMVKGELGYKYPEQYDFDNKGISGNRITDIYARIKPDIINLSPDYMSILCGVNDSGLEFAHKNGVSTEKFEKIYSMLIEEVTAALPNIKIMILEPFLLRNKTTEDAIYGGSYENFRRDVEEKAAVAKKLAEKYNLAFVPLQAKFDEVYNPEAPNYWAFDGVHPTAAGHALIAKEWLKKFEEIK